MPTYKTPGVYVEEISLFPPSVAEVATAIPAFIGYTEKANCYGKNLQNQAVKITSQVDYEQRFGYGPKLEIGSVELSRENEVKEVILGDKSRFHLYDSIRMFYSNGGGNCYVISIGSYEDEIDPDSFATGLSILEAEDEPTLILFPDGVLLDDADLYRLQQAALKQAAQLKDRFAIMDIRESATQGSPLDRLGQNIQKFRDTIGINNLKYGAAYAPYIVSTFDKGLRYRDINGKMKRDGLNLETKELAGSNPSPALITALDSYVFLAGDEKNFAGQLAGAIKSVDAGSKSKSLEQEYSRLLTEYRKGKTAGNVKAIAKFLSQVVDKMADDLVQGDKKFQHPDLLKEVRNRITDTFAGARSDLKDFGGSSFDDTKLTDPEMGSFVDPALSYPSRKYSGATTIPAIGRKGDKTYLKVPAYIRYAQPKDGKVTRAKEYELTFAPKTDSADTIDSFEVTLLNESIPRTAYVAVLSVPPESVPMKKFLIKGGSLEVGQNATQVTAPAHGTLAKDGTMLKYSPEDSFLGVDTFTYTVSGQAQPSTAYVAVVDRDQAGLDASITAFAEKNKPAAITLAAVSTYGTGNGHTTDKGNTLIKTDSILSLTPASTFTGDSDSFQYKVVYLEGKIAKEYTVTVTFLADEDRFDKIIDGLSGLFSAVNEAVADLQRSIDSYDKQFEDSLLILLPVVGNILKEIEQRIDILPPSGAIAGVYAYVDQIRGVWKAPANVSLNSVVDLTARIDNNFQEGMNVDVTAGKSINAIRPFTGKGIMVWGARTLAGNDNEWRYVSVRRFFNMVEESCKKSTYWAVFEPNDANLWVKAKAMLENYLIEKWRDGALAGAKPEQAFFVHVGLGKTMTAQDILEGRLIVEIGMAVVRPAEFIVLRFMHKMQES